jgi:alanyl-tRNA synthetase
MPLSHVQLREKFTKFWQRNGHKEVPPISLVPKDDPTTLFTGSGMQPLVPYLLGEPHPLGKKLYNIQPCFRSQDIEEVGDNRHTTFFEMMGNWSLGTYFKQEQLAWVWEFFTKELGLPKEKLYISVFEGTKDLPKDEESIKIWKKLGVPEEKIFKYGADKNWWSRAGIPENMPSGEPGGPDSEVFYEFTQVPHDPKYGKECHPNCDCGRFLEIGNSVFMQYKKVPSGTFQELPNKNVDFGGGLERIMAAVNNEPDMFKTDVYAPLMKTVEQDTAKKYEVNNQSLMRVIADHLKAATFLIAAGVKPSNKEQGYVLRRLLRAAAVKMDKLAGLEKLNNFNNICDQVVNIYNKLYFDESIHRKIIQQVISEETSRFKQTIDRGLREISKLKTIDGKIAFDLYQSYGFPLEITEELFREKGQTINKKQFYAEFEKHKNLSRTASSGMFKGGLADQSEQTIKYHTATHLIHQALFDVLGQDIRQEGSNITSERLRFDYYSPVKPTPQQIKQVETIVNEKIKQSLPVSFKIMSKEEAYKIGAKSFFREKYPEMVKVYFIGNYSKEFCAGPHVKNTSEVGKIEIFKSEKIGSNLYRIYGK